MRTTIIGGFVNNLYEFSTCDNFHSDQDEVKFESNVNKTKHARDLIPSINQQVKIGNLLSTLRPNQ